MKKQKNEMVVVQSMPVAPSPKQSEPAVLTLKQAVTAIFRSRWLLVTTTVLGLLVGGWSALGKPNEYVSQGSFVFRPGGEQIVINPIGNPTDKPGHQPLRGNAVAIVKSEDVLRRTIRRLGAAYILAPYSPRLDPNAPDGFVKQARGWIYSLQRKLHKPSKAEYKESDALLVLQDTLSVTAPKESQVLRVNVLANDPVRAQRTLEVFMEEAQARHLEVYSSERSIKEVEAAHEAARNSYEKATHALKDFLTKNNLQDFEGDLKQAQEDARAATGELTALRTQIQTNRTTLAGLKERQEGLSPTTTVTAIVQVPNARVPVLRAGITKVETELLEKQGVLQPNDEGIKVLQRRLAKLKGDLETELAKKVETRTETRDEPNQEYLATKQNIRQLELSLVVDEERLPGVQRRAGEARKLASSISRLQGAWRQLSHRTERTQTNLDNAEQMLALARKKSELDRKRISSLAMLDRPNLPLIKEGPKRTRIVLGGLLAGLFLGIALVIIRALTDTTVRRAEDLEEIGTGKVLATIPNLDKTSVKRHENMRVKSWS